MGSFLWSGTENTRHASFVSDVKKCGGKGHLERHTQRRHQRIYFKPFTTCSSFLHEGTAKQGSDTSTWCKNCLWQSGGSAIDNAEGHAARRAGNLQLAFAPPAVAVFPGCEKDGWTTWIHGLSQFSRCPTPAHVSLAPENLHLEKVETVLHGCQDFRFSQARMPIGTTLSCLVL